MPPLDWCDDQELGPGFRQLTLSFTPDYDGEVTASVVRNRRLLPPTTAAILYLHGFVDYFSSSGTSRIGSTPRVTTSMVGPSQVRALTEGCCASERLPSLRGVLRGDHESPRETARAVPGGDGGVGRHKGSQSDREVFLQLTLGRSTREGCWTRTVGNERSEFTIEPEGRPRATNEGEAEMKWLTALDDFRNWLITEAA